MENKDMLQAAELDNNFIALSIQAMPAMRTTFLEHTFVIGEDNGQTVTRYGCFGSDGNEGEGHHSIGINIDGYPRQYVAAHVCGNAEDERDRYSSYLPNLNTPGFFLGDTCNILYGVGGVCHQMANRIISSNFNDTYFPLGRVLGSGISYLLYGPWGYRYAAYKQKVHQALGLPLVEQNLLQGVNSDFNAMINLYKEETDEIILAEKRLELLLIEANLFKTITDTDINTLKVSLTRTVRALVDIEEKLDKVKTINQSQCEVIDNNIHTMLAEYKQCLGENNYKELFHEDYNNNFSFMIKEYFSKLEKEEASMKLKENDKLKGSILKDTINAESKPLIDDIYDKINDVIGGDNKEQFFCMMNPGITLSPKEFICDNDYKKSAIVAANESRIANKLFDACHVTGGDNGHILAQQYLSALDMLTPKVNSDLAKEKNTLRNMLMTKMSYQFDDGRMEGTLQQIFYRLYEEWVAEKRKWSEVQQKEREAIEKKYPNNSEDSKQAIENDFLEWYQTVAESYLLAIEAKLGKVLGVFSINDMKIIEGILDSGSGGEIKEAKDLVNNAKKLNPDGGSTYPVTLEPADWYKYLESNFTGIDLLETPEALFQKYEALVNRRTAILSQIAHFESLDESSQLSAAIKTLNDAQVKFNETSVLATKAYGDGAAEVLKLAVGFAAGKTDIDSFIFQGVCDIANQDKDKASDITVTAVSDLLGKVSDVQEAQDNYVNAAGNVAAAAREVILNKTMQFTDILQPLSSSLDEINNQIDQVKSKLDIAIIASKNQSDSNTILSNKASEGFMEVVINSSFSSLYSESEKKSSSSNSSTGGSFLFGGYSRTSSSSSAEFSDMMQKSTTSIDIGMHVTKVAITRNWFNPGVFLLSKDMYNTSKKKISFNENDYPDVNTVQDQFDAMNQCIFPVYPTAFVIAKDVSIKFSNEENFSSSLRTALQEQTSRGGGVFCFKHASSTSSAEEKSMNLVQNSANSVTIKFPGSQIIGYYLEKTPRDESTYMNDNGVLYGELAESMSITDFISQYKEMLDELSNNR